MNKACIFSVEFEGLQIIKTTDLPPYEGSYSVDPLAKAEIVLPTKNRNMTDDITIRKIRQLEVGNKAGGNTLIIGEDL